MSNEILDHYREFSLYTFPGAYLEQLRQDLPDDVRELGKLVRWNIIHPTTLRDGNTYTNADLRFGDMTKVPWYRQKEDDMLPTAAAIVAELYRRDEKGLTATRSVDAKLVISCRYVAILMASILKAKGIPARVRAGHAPYFPYEFDRGVSADHWITQYWLESEKRWVTIDVDGSISFDNSFDPYDVPADKFDFPAAAWLGVRNGTIDPLRFWNAKPERGPLVLLWSLFYDFHCLMNNEILYIHGPRLAGAFQFANASLKELKKIDDLATLMLDPDTHFKQLQTIWENDKDFRLLGGGLI